MEAADVLQRVSGYFGIKLEELAKKRTPHRDSRAVVMEMMYRYGKISQEEIGKRVGASRETVSNYLRLLKLPADVQNYLSRGDLTYSHARELLVLHDESQISKLAQLAVKKRMSVLQLEDEVLNLNLPLEGSEREKVSGGARWVDPNVRSAQRTLETILGMRVRIRDRKGKGKITIEYGTLEDFDRVVGMLKGK